MSTFSQLTNSNNDFIVVYTHGFIFYIKFWLLLKLWNESIDHIKTSQKKNE